MNTTTERRKEMVDIGVKVGVLENTVELLTNLGTKIESNLEKQMEVSAQLSKIVAVHEERLENQEVNLDKHENADNSKFDRLNETIAKVNDNLTKSIEKVNDNLSKKIEGFQKELDPIKKKVWQATGAIAIIMAVAEAISFFLK